MPAQIKSALKMKYIWIFMDACPIFWVTFKILPFTQWKWKWKSLSCDSLRLHGLYSPWNSPDQNSGVGSLSLLQGIFPTQGSKPGLPHCRWILYQLNHKGSPRILEVGSLSLLQRIFPTQESNRDLLHCRRILYQLSYQGSPFTGGILKQRNGGRDKV